MAKFKFDYDAEDDDLFLHSEERSKGSIEIGNFVLDFNNKGKVVGIEFIDATKVLSDFVDVEISKKFLSELSGCEVTVEQKNNFLIIKIVLLSKGKKIPCVINAPNIMEPSPAVAFT